MSMYNPGLNEARANLDKMTLEQLLAHIDMLYGRKFLSYGATIEDVREEAKRQAELDFIIDVREHKDKAWFKSRFRRYLPNLYGDDSED